VRFLHFPSRPILNQKTKPNNGGGGNRTPVRMSTRYGVYDNVRRFNLSPRLAAVGNAFQESNSSLKRGSSKPRSNPHYWPSIPSPWVGNERTVAALIKQREQNCCWRLAFARFVNAESGVRVSQPSVQSTRRIHTPPFQSTCAGFPPVMQVTKALRASVKR
jgi:hypothetical protein